MPDGYMTVAGAAKAWGRSPNTIRRWCQRRHIPGAERVGYTWLIPATATPPQLPTGAAAHVKRKESAK